MGCIQKLLFEIDHDKGRLSRYKSRSIFGLIFSSIFNEGLSSKKGLLMVHISVSWVMDRVNMHTKYDRQ